MMMFRTRNQAINSIVIMCILFVFVTVFTFTTFDSNEIEPDICFAAVGDYETVYFSAEPYDANQDCVWTLMWDEDNTPWANYNIVKDRDPQDYLQLTINGNACTITVLKYYKFIINYKVCFILRATSVENENFYKDCLITLK